MLGQKQHCAKQFLLLAREHEVMFVEVPANMRGAHMSRFVELLTEWADKPVSSQDFKELLSNARRRAGSYSAEASVLFKYFMPRLAPVSGKRGILDYECQFSGRVDAGGFVFTLGTRVPVTTLCPCSKAISDYGAHNQRAVVDVQIRYGGDSFIWLEDLVELVEREASCPVYPILKREDEKYVTEAAYRNPKFVEDVVRDVVLRIGALGGITWLTVSCESIESIHNHSAFASVEGVAEGWSPVTRGERVSSQGAP